MELKPCQDGKIRNPKSGRCVDIDGAIGRELLARGAVTLKPCKRGTIRNPSTGNCVKIDGKVGRELARGVKDAGFAVGAGAGVKSDADDSVPPVAAWGNLRGGSLSRDRGKREIREAAAAAAGSIKGVKASASASASASAAPRVAIPSYHTIMAQDPSLEDQYMEQVEAWPATRTNLLQLIQTRLEPVLEAKSRVITTLEEIFHNLRKLTEDGGKASAFGSLYRGCLRDLSREATMSVGGKGKNRQPKPEPRCVEADLLGATTKRAIAIYLIIKLLPMVDLSILDVPYNGLLRYAVGVTRTRAATSRVRWVGSDNPLREILLGRFLNRLVQRSISPHFPMIYESFILQPKNEDEDVKDGFAMEMCHFDFDDYIKKHLVNVVDDVTRSQLLRVALIQIVQGLAAAAHHFDFRHNDLHGMNAMMTFITNGVYTYKIGAKYYSVPNAGMCWKMIDFGNGSSNVFGAHDNAAAAIHSGAFFERINAHEDHAMEMCDIVRLLDFVLVGVSNSIYYAQLTPARLAQAIAKQAKAAKAAKKTTPKLPDSFTPVQISALKALEADLQGYLAIIQRIARASTKRGTAKQVVEFRAKDVQSFDHTNPAFLTMIANSNLMRTFLEVIASDYAISAREAARVDPATVFDIDAMPFDPREVLTGKEGEHFQVNNFGNLIPK